MPWTAPMKPATSVCSISCAPVVRSCSRSNSSNSSGRATKPPSPAKPSVTPVSPAATPLKDTPAERKAIARNGRFVRTNPHTPRHRVSFHWNALLPPWVSWRSIVEEFIAAKAALRAGDISPFKTFVNETLGESWEDQLGAIDDYDFLDARKQDYEFGDPWPEERDRFMAADRQEAGGEHYWYVIRAFGPFGQSRLVSYGPCATRDQLEELRKEHNVPGHKRHDRLRVQGVRGLPLLPGYRLEGVQG